MSRVMFKLSGATAILTLHLVFVLILEGNGVSDPCQGKKDGAYRDPAECRHYFRCEDGVRIIVKCLEGQVFDQPNGNCTRRAEIPCTADPANPTLVGTPCKGKEGHIRPSVVSCFKYLLCLRGIFTPIDCPLGLIFSEKTYTCIPNIDHCSTHKPAEDKTIRSQKGTNSPYINICGTKYREPVADPLRCSKYIFCGINPKNEKDKKAYITMSGCQPGLLYSDTESRCMNPKRVKCQRRWRNVTMFGPEPK